MSNLGEGIYEMGVRDGQRLSRLLLKVEYISMNIRKGRSEESIADFFRVDIEVVHKVAELIEENADVTDYEIAEYLMYTYKIFDKFPCINEYRYDGYYWGYTQ